MKALAFIGGLYFISRTGITYVFFQSSPSTGTAVSAAISFILAIIMMMCLLNPMTRPIRANWPRSANLWLLFIGWIGLSILWTTASDRFTAFSYWLIIVSELVFMAGLVVLRNRAKLLTHFMKGVWLGAVILSVVAFSTFSPGTRMGDEVFLHPNAIAFPLLLSAPCIIYLLRIGESTITSGRLMVASLMLITTTIFLTASKTALVVLFLIFIYYFFASQIRLTYKVYSIFLTGFILIGTWSLIAPYFEGYFSTYNYAAETSLALSATGRTLIWEATWPFIIEKPLIGHGLMAFRDAGPQIFSDVRLVHAHNELVQIAYSYGAIGAGLAIIIYFSIFRSSREIAKRTRSTHLSDFANTVLIACLVRGLMEANSVALVLPLWLGFLILSECAIAAQIRELQLSEMLRDKGLTEI